MARVHRVYISGLVIAVLYALLLGWRLPLRPDDVVAAALFGAGATALAWMIRQRIFAKRNQQGVERYRRGDFEGASTIFRSNARRFRYPQSAHGMCIFNLALARLRLGDADGALRLFLTVSETSAARRSAIIHHACPHWISICHALRGDLAGARRWLRHAAGTGRSALVLERVANGIVLCRERRFDQALALLKMAYDELSDQDREYALPWLDLVRASAEGNRERSI